MSGLWPLIWPRLVEIKMVYLKTEVSPAIHLLAMVPPIKVCPKLVRMQMQQPLNAKDLHFGASKLDVDRSPSPCDMGHSRKFTQTAALARNCPISNLKTCWFLLVPRVGLSSPCPGPMSSGILPRLIMPALRTLPQTTTKGFPYMCSIFLTQLETRKLCCASAC